MLTIFTQLLIPRGLTKGMLTRMHVIVPKAIHCTLAAQAHSRSVDSDDGVVGDEKMIKPDILYDMSGTVYGTDVLPQRVVFQTCFTAGMLPDVLCKKVCCINSEMQF